MLRDEIISKIRAADTARLFVEIAGSAELDAAISGRKSANACYVSRESIKLNAQGEFYQRATEVYSVVTICRNTSGYGAEAGKVAENMQKLVFSALSGFAVPTTNDVGNADVTDPAIYTGGRLAMLMHGLHVWEDRYMLSYTVQTNQQI